jgi:LPXTG-motif cell wall-anchored protein
MSMLVHSPRRLGRLLAATAAVAVAGLALGAGPASAAATPSAPLNIDAYQSGAGEVTVDWDFPADEGTSDITSFTVALPGLTSQVIPVTDGMEAIFTSVPLGSHTVTVVATNDDGTGPAATATVEVGNPPSAPLNLVATQTGPKQVTVTFDAPADAGSSAISNYGIGYSQGNMGDGDDGYPATTRSHVFDGLEPGDYAFVVFAINDSGMGESAVHALTVTAAVPTTPAAVTPGVTKTPTVAPKTSVTTATAATQLPRTGTRSEVFALTGLSLLVVGGALTVGGRRREHV